MFLPVCSQDMIERGIERLDFVLVTGDAYVDHPSFAHAVISRVLESKGYTVGIIAQPNWRSCDGFKILGRPRLGFLVSAGNLDSMVAHYTASKKIRSNDYYSPGGQAGKRPNRAVIAYCNRIREAYGKTVPIIIGGIEASLRRFAHYDYWDDRVRRSILIDSGADILVYGMGERQICEIAELLHSGVDMPSIKSVRGTVYIEDDQTSLPKEAIITHSFEEVSEDKRKYAESFKEQYDEQDHVTGRAVVQKCREKYVVQNTPADPLTTAELDRVYALAYERDYHPVYRESGGIPAIDEVKFSITSSRGCFGGCNFCALTFHQGRVVTARSHKSVINEATGFTYHPDFKGYIHDVGGPTANFRLPSCSKQAKEGFCRDRQCLFPQICRSVEVTHADYLALLKKLREIPRVKKVFIRSGIRFDYLLKDKNEDFFKELCQHHISGQLKIAPEHISENVLQYMGKPGGGLFGRFKDRFDQYNSSIGKKQYIVPYLMSSHPGSTLHDAIELAEYLRDNRYNPEQVQDFYPTPGTISTCMYYTEIDPRTMKRVYVPKTYKERQLQRALLQYKNPKNRSLVLEALKKAGREDLIGRTKGCLV
ncbi:MAG: YgiQ family radical SAM protein [Oscillospiraceae bacterium]|nr:YgiQ family radical SAM protein [Oscillospiraceae bacterium]